MFHWHLRWCLSHPRSRARGRSDSLCRCTGSSAGCRLPAAEQTQAACGCGKCTRGLGFKSQLRHLLFGGTRASHLTSFSFRGTQHTIGTQDVSNTTWRAPATLYPMNKTQSLISGASHSSRDSSEAANCDTWCHIKGMSKGAQRKTERVQGRLPRGGGI